VQARAAAVRAALADLVLAAAVEKEPADFAAAQEPRAASAPKATLARTAVDAGRMAARISGRAASFPVVELATGRPDLAGPVG
jgi:hypothetical protein